MLIGYSAINIMLMMIKTSHQHSKHWYIHNLGDKVVYCSIQML